MIKKCYNDRFITAFFDSSADG